MPSVRIVTPLWFAVAVIAGIALIVWRKKLSPGLLAAYVILVLASTVILRARTSAPRLMLQLFWSYKAWIFGNKTSLMYEDVANILMTVPVGYLVPWLVRKFRLFWAMLSVLVLEAVIESLQYLLCCGVCELDDVFSGLIGAVLGYLLYLAVSRGLGCIRDSWEKRGRRRKRRKRKIAKHWSGMLHTLCMVLETIRAHIIGLSVSKSGPLCVDI